MEAVDRNSSAGRAQPRRSFLSLQIYKTGVTGHHKAEQTALDLQSIISSHGSITTSVNSSPDGYEKLLGLEHGEIYLAEPGDHLHYHLAYHPEWFLKERHIIRTAEFLINFDKQISSGEVVIKFPYRADSDFDEDEEYKPRVLNPPSLASELSTIDTTSQSDIRRLTSDIKSYSLSCAGQVSRPAAILFAENRKCEESPIAAADFEETASRDSRPERSDVFELLDSAVIEILAPDIMLAANVIAHLYKLPANLRSLVYGFITHGSEGRGYSDGAPPPAQQGSESQQNFPISQPYAKKLKSNQKGDEDPEDDKPRDRRSRSRVYSNAIVSKLKYACHFNIKDPETYCVRNEIGGTGDFYSSCMGTGWTELRNLLAHLRDHHRLAQCTRCWDIFDEPRLLDFHRDRLEPRCPDFSLRVELRAGIDPNKWEDVEKALQTPRPNKQKSIARKSDFEKWMDVWNILFPEDVYPNLQKPQHPFYVDHESLYNSFTSSAETEKRLVIVKAIWDEKAKIATLDTSQHEYHPSLEEVQQTIREADAILISSSRQALQARQTSQPLPPSSPTSYDQANDEIQGRNDDVSPQLPISDIQEDATSIEDAAPQYSLVQDASTNQATEAQGLTPATAALAATPRTMPLNGWLKDYPFYTDEEFHDLCKGP